MWTIEAPNIHFVLSAKSPGYIGFGPSVNGSEPHMLQSDVVIGAAGSVEDYWITAQQTCQGTLGVCTDSQQGGTKSITNDTFHRVDGFTTVKYTRSLAAEDPTLDLEIADEVGEYVWAMNNFDALGTHTLGRNWFYMNPFETPPCPSPNGQVCSDQGTCTKGCCVCDSGFDGYDCSKPIEPDDPSDLSPEIDRDDYTFSKELAEGFTIFWKIDEEAGEIELAIESQSTGWVALGPTTENMINSDIMFGWVDSEGPHAVDSYITARSDGCPGICRDTELDGTNDILDFNGNEANGVTQLKWIRKLNTEDTEADHPFNKGILTVSWGFGSADGPGVIQHATNAKGLFEIDFFTGEAITISKTTERVTHGVLMFVAWILIIPFSGFLAHHFKGEQFPWWFNVHRIANIFALLLVLVSFVIGVVMTTSHFDNVHKVIGLIIVVLGLAQPVIGTVADKWFEETRSKTPLFPDISHWVIGWGSFLLAAVNVALGIDLYGANIGWLVGYILVAAIVIIILIVSFVVRWIKKRN